MRVGGISTFYTFFIILLRLVTCLSHYLLAILESKQALLPYTPSSHPELRSGNCEKWLGPFRVILRT